MQTDEEAIVIFPHPAICLLSWIGLMGIVQGLPPSALAIGILSSGIAGFFFSAARKRCLGLLYRTRWLFMALFFAFAWGMPADGGQIGRQAGGQLLTWLPGMEGIVAALTHGAKLFLTLALSAFFLAYLPRGRLLSGLRAVLSPLSVFGIDSDRLVVRLMLAFSYLDETQRENASLRDFNLRRDWRVLLESPASVFSFTPSGKLGDKFAEGRDGSVIEIECVPWSPLDGMWLLFLFAGICMLFL